MSRLERIVAACGGILLDGGTRALIPGPDHSAKDRSVSLMESDGRIIIHCFSPKDDWRAVRAALDRRGLLHDRSDAKPGSDCAAPIVQPVAEDRLARAMRIWEEGRPLRRTPAAAYLRRRAILAGAGSDALRFHARMTSVDDKARRPALLAAITNAAGQLQGVQVTLLSAHGAAKASVPTPRRVIGRLLGGVVRLSSIADTLLLAEGVESALSAADQLGAPAWAALTAYNLSLFEPPPLLRRLIVCPDNDEAGRSAFATLHERLSARLVLECAPAPGSADDWNTYARTAKRLRL